MSNRKIYHVSENNSEEVSQFYSSLKKAMTAVSNMIHIELRLKRQKELGRNLTVVEETAIAKSEPSPKWFQSGVLWIRENTNYTIFVIELDTSWPERNRDEIKVYYPTSRRNGNTYEALVNEQRIATRFEAEPFERSDGEYQAGWYASRPSGGCLGGGCGLTFVDGPYESESEAYESALASVLQNGWIVDRLAAEAKATAEANDRIADQKERGKLTPEKAAAKLIEAGIFQAGWKISPRVWKKPLTKTRVQAALNGDPNAAGCLCRDAVKN
jgi:hypothetical protein